VFKAGPAQFGYDLKKRPNIRGKLAVGQPYKMCNSQVQNPELLAGKIVLIERGNCMFVDKVKNQVENNGVLDYFSLFFPQEYVFKCPTNICSLLLKV
jgi:mannosidase alpha-like ER degradation enhancer 3